VRFPLSYATICFSSTTSWSTKKPLQLQGFLLLSF
jgi:hypothetical protein